jgi:hypothetical protein
MPVESAVIDQFYEGQAEVIKYLVDQNEISFSSLISDLSRKSLVLAMASYLETVVCDIVREVVGRRSRGDEIVKSLIEQKAIKRQYHTYFNWEGNNANIFFALFGDNFSTRVKAKVAANADLNEAIRSFLQIGNIRNLLVHNNYLSYPVDASREELLQKFQQAVRFIEFLEVTLLPAQADDDLARSGEEVMIFAG